MRDFWMYIVPGWLAGVAVALLIVWIASPSPLVDEILGAAFALVGMAAGMGLNLWRINHA